MDLQNEILKAALKYQIDTLHEVFDEMKRTYAGDAPLTPYLFNQVESHMKTRLEQRLLLLGEKN